MRDKPQIITGKAPRSKRNAAASALALGQFQQRREKPRKGPGSYSRAKQPKASAWANI